MKQQRGFVLPSPALQYGALGAFAVIVGLGIALTVQTARLDSCKAEHAKFVAEVKVLGEQAEKEKAETEAKHKKVFKETKNGYAKSISDARNNAVSNFLRNANPGGGGLSQAPGNPQGTDATGEKPLACPAGFVRDCAEDSSRIEAFQQWVRGIGFPVE